MSAQVIPFPATTAIAPCADDRVPEFLLRRRGDADGDASLIQRLARLKVEIVYLDCTKDDVPRPSYGNMLTFLEQCGIGIQYDTFAQTYSLTGVAQHHALTDAAFEDIRMAMLASGLRVEEKTLWQFLRSVGRESKHNPLLEHLGSLQWDGEKRLDTLLVRHFGADDTPYTRAVTRAWHIGLIKRLISPGCQFDNVLTLAGDEGLLKSTYFRQMGYDIYFTDNLPIAADGKVTIEQTRGKWIAELAEIVGINKREDEEIKAFITRQVDEKRLSYDRETTKVPRQFGLAATTNKLNPFRGSDGNRRWWLVYCTRKMDVTALTAERDQVWAEAMVAAKAGQRHWLPDDLEAAAREMQKAATRVHPLQERLEALLEPWKDRPCFVPTDELLDAIGVTPEHIGRLSYQHTDIVDGAMRRLGFQPCRGGKRKQCGKAQDRLKVAGFESENGWNDTVLIFNGQGFEAMSNVDYSDRQHGRRAA